MGLDVADNTIFAKGNAPAAPDAPAESGKVIYPAIKLPSHIPALDGIRGFAVLLVLFCHATQRPFGDPAAINAAFNGPIDKALLTAARLSWTGVDMFFVLSGFLITGILYDAKGKQHFFRNFYARRTVRIFPLYYISLVLFLLVLPRLGPWVNQGMGDYPPGSTAWYWLYLSNFSQSIIEQGGTPVEHIVHVSWSLSIEEQFYLFWPLVVFLCTRKKLLGIATAMLFGSVALRTALLYFEKNSYAMGFTPCRLDGLAVGALIALIARGPHGIGKLIRPARLIAPGAALAIMVMIAAMYKLGYRTGVGQTPGYVIAGPTLFALMYGALLVIAVAANGWFKAIFSFKFLRIFGKYSYAVYLLHLPIVVMVAEHWFKPDRFHAGRTMLPGLLAFYAVTWTAALLAAILSWNLIERHFLKLKNYFPMEKKASTATAWEGKDVAVAEPKV
jgi:peptidoglycan/LPS O-acetylase OafA/YrhL